MPNVPPGIQAMPGWGGAARAASSLRARAEMPGSTMGPLGNRHRRPAACHRLSGYHLKIEGVFPEAQRPRRPLALVPAPPERPEKGKVAERPPGRSARGEAGG